MGLVPPPAYGRGALVGIVAARAATTGSSTPRPRCDPRSRKGVATVRLGEHLGDDAGGVVHDVSIRWIHSFLSADKKKTYCIYEAPSVEAIREAARRLGIPADVIVEIDQVIEPVS